MRKTLVVHHQHAWRCLRTRVALSETQGVQITTIEQISARLAGGFLRPIDPEAVKEALITAVQQPLGDLDNIKQLPGFHRAAAATLSKAWSAGLSLNEESKSATKAESKARLVSLALLEKAVLSKIPANQLRPRDLVDAAIKNIRHTPAIFGRIEIHGSTEMSPVWRPLLLALSKHSEVVWVADARHVPDWLRSSGVNIAQSTAAKPSVQAISCATPRHEILEAFRWAREHLANGIKPEQIAIATASPDQWDDHVLALAEASNLPIHFVHGRSALSTSEGQLAASLAEILLRGLSRRRILRLVGLLRSIIPRFNSLPSSWWHGLSKDSPLLEVADWERAIASLTIGENVARSDQHQLLTEVVTTLSKGLNAASDIGEILLSGQALSIWQTALTEGPPTALDVTLTGLRVNDRVEPEASLIWAPASALASIPRQFVWLVGLTSRSWPRHPSQDPLLPDHVVHSDRLDPLPIHHADRRDFSTICDTTTAELMISRARRDSRGRLNGVSPLFPDRDDGIYLTQSRRPDHAVTPSDRLMARPEEFGDSALGQSAFQTWADWHRPQLTSHDGLVRHNHPLLLRSLDRRQSATSLAKLLRDPLGYLWTYGFEWSQPEETDEPLTLDALAFGSLLHEILQDTVTKMERAEPGSFAKASAAMITSVIESVVGEIDIRWVQDRPVPPPAVWKRKLAEAAELARVALTHREDPLHDQLSWAEVPFGGDQKADSLTDEARSLLPWDPTRPVTIPGTTINIGGAIDRLDLSGDKTRSRVTDYKSGKVPKPHPQLRKGTELQRCLYAYAVKTLISTHPEVEARLLYPKRDGQALPLDNPEETLKRLVNYLNAAYASFAAGATFPGPATDEEWYDLRLLLPGAAKESYLNMKRSLVAEQLATVAPLWEEP